MAAALRRAAPTDAAAAAHVIARALLDYGIRFEPEGRDADVKTFGQRPDVDDLVVEEGGAVVGVGSVGPHGDEGVAWISKVFVLREARGRGHGSAILEALHDAARARGYREVRLRTRVVFREAIALYERAGYVQTSAPGAILERGDVLYARRL
ncbi:MAG: GNAT family N-acetyltransferase [Deltaproteobacteria bacterium]|nr:GNAT family N-acetyltransferase [Deltaproteobacteria bacterium]